MVKTQESRESLKIEDYSKSDISGLSSLRLPRLELPTFDGDLGTWLTFRGVFTATIDTNKHLSEAAKFGYLIGALKGDSVKLVSGFSMSGKCYKEAWEILTNRYDNRRNLVYALLSKFINVKPIEVNNPKSVFEVLDTSQVAILVCGKLATNLACQECKLETSLI
ncbi:hypothetical protein AVEN_261833-1 [Araneus ventricosus]|uniref:Uncharacterized protein n=1 Tax=Araneus ventricosus TaxID=182803 RepID=A0A4Y2HU41_ARAVE|nr:hypothetical protein AVEN_261833-1 [Araneus ventricosus]